jgi:hypothetical protein
MRKIETILGSAVWMAITLAMMYAALEPVELQAHEMRLAEAGSAACASDIPCASLLCEISSL